MLIFHMLTDLDHVSDQGSAMRALASSRLANTETRIVNRQSGHGAGPSPRVWEIERGLSSMRVG
jgi:hypothetical protein